MVILKAINPKTREAVTLDPFRLPPSHKGLALRPTAVEARHFAATYALFRVCSMRNVHMMLPPAYRDLWKGAFQELKDEDVKQGKAWMYDADPFQARKEKELQAEAAKDEKGRQKGKDASKAGLQTGLSSGPLASTDMRGPRQGMNGLSRIPKVDMGKRMRAQIEDLVRKNVIWNPYQVKMSASETGKVINELSGLGFRRSHVEEAVTYCKDKEEALEWLLIYVPEDDLPEWSLPDGYVAGISMASGDVKKEAVIQRLVIAGYSTDLCKKILHDIGGDEGRAAAALQQILVNGSLQPSDAEGNTASDSEDDDVWAEEQKTVEAIFGDRYTPISSDQCQIRLETRDQMRSVSIWLRKPVYGHYPQVVPIMSLISEPPLPAYIRLSIIKKTVVHAELEFRGEEMIFSLIDWLESKIQGIIAAPGKLLDVTAAASAPVAFDDAQISASQSAVPRQTYTHRAERRFVNKDSCRIKAQWEAKQNTIKQQTMLAGRKKLPAWKMRDVLVEAVQRHSVTIISGETGSGKSTQSVQFILDDMIQKNVGATANIVCTQPRRISVLGLADRVSEERCDMVGREVGYTIRGESRQTAGITRVTFVTTGVLLRQMQSHGGADSDMVTALADVSHVVVDEVHERSLDTDFLLALLKRLLEKRHDLRVILMSATLDANVFAEYFKDSGEVGRVEIEGRAHPVEDYYLEDVLRMTRFDYDFDADRDDADAVLPSNGNGAAGPRARIDYELIAQTVEGIDGELGTEDGGILIFLPGNVEIERTLDAVRMLPNMHALPLHASLSPMEQKRVFLPPPKGRRKVIAATNVAETSITIEDIVAVIDSGRVKETTYDPQNNMVRLEEVWASRAACKQRRGRAGRVRAGNCYKLFSRKVEMTTMLERPEPEIRRVPLEQLSLSVKAMGVVDVHSFLADTITPPDTLAVEGAMKLLCRMGALDGDRLTALGQHLASIPADLRCGKLMVYGATFGCLEACLTIAAILTTRSPFYSPIDKRSESKTVRTSYAKGQGDLMADLRAFEEWSFVQGSRPPREMRVWCEQRYLSHRTLNDILSNRSQYLSSLKESGFVPREYHRGNSKVHSSYNRHHDNDALIRALIAGSFSPQIARIEFPEKKFAPSVSGAVELDPEARTIKYFNQDNGRVFVHPSSTVFEAQGFPGSAIMYMSYFNKMATSKVFIRDLTRKSLSSRSPIIIIIILDQKLSKAKSVQRIYSPTLLRAHRTRHQKSRLDRCRRLASSQGLGKDRRLGVAHEDVTRSCLGHEDSGSVFGSGHG